MTFMSPDVDVRPDLGFQEPGDHEKFSHYVPKADLMKAMVEGTPCIAMCGKKWVPTRDPEKFPLCPACKTIYEKWFSDG